MKTTLDTPRPVVSMSNRDIMTTSATRPTYQEILYTLLCASLNIPSDWADVAEWCIAHRMIARVQVVPEHLWSLALTTTGENLLNQTSAYFRTLVNAFHSTGQLTPKDTNGTNENNDTQQQGHDGSKGKGTKKTKDHASKH